MHVGLRMKFLHILAPKLRLQNIKFCENLVGVAPFYADGRTNEDVGRVSQPPPPQPKKTCGDENGRKFFMGYRNDETQIDLNPN